MKRIKFIVALLLQLVLIAFLVLIAREPWVAYEQEKLSALFAKEATIVRGRVINACTPKKTGKIILVTASTSTFLTVVKIISCAYCRIADG